MAACHPKLSTERGAEIFLSRFAEGEWQGVVRPWLEEARGGRLERSLVVAPTRGQTHALKQRCLAEGVSLLGVEFLTPGLAARKRGARPAPARGLQLLVLRTTIEARAGALATDDPARPFWRSLASDLDAALDDYEELLRAGLGAGSFPRPELREVFGELSSWMARHGSPLEDAAALLGAPDPGAAPVADRLLILAGGPECRGDFAGLAALALRCPSVTVALPEPEFRGRIAWDEDWPGMWERLLGVELQVADVADPEETCSAVADLWSGERGPGRKAAIVLGQTRSDEMERVADEVADLLRAGSDNVAVVFPGAGAAHARLARALASRGAAFTDLIGACGTAPIEDQIQLAIVDFYARGCRIEEMLALWPLLGALGLVRIPASRARAVCRSLFDETQSHAMAPHAEALAASGEEDRRELGRVARLLLPAWPAMLTLREALDRFEAARDALKAAPPPGWETLRAFARRASEPMPAAAILEAIRSFLPSKAPLDEPGQRGGFARVTLTTLRRAVGVAWSDVIFAEANHGAWPQRRESSCWLDDDTRRGTGAAPGFPMGLATGDVREALERRMYRSIARDTRRRVAFSASLFNEEDPEERLEPNAWLERVLWDAGLLADTAAGGFGRLTAAPRAARAAGPGEAPALVAWAETWRRRRDPAAAFDEWFFAHARGLRPAELSAKVIEEGLRDPVGLWFGAVLQVERVEWRPFSRTDRKLIGTAVHGVLARSLRGTPEAGAFFRMPARAEAEASLEAELSALRARWPANRYWDSLHLDVGGAARDLLAQVYGLAGAPYGAVEARIPDGASIPAGPAGRIPVHGRMDLVLSDRPSWEKATVLIVDYKTGGDARLSVRRMASKGAAIQLGVYLEAARSVDASGSVWMLKPGEKPSSVGTAELDMALERLDILGRHLTSGVYGALTPDRDEYTVRFEWPLACAPIAHAVLQEKFRLTFGAAAAAQGGDDD
jgi:hypothetical protein